MMSTIDTAKTELPYTPDEIEEINARFDDWKRFMRDILHDVSIADRIPEGGPILDIVEPGSRPEAEPDIRTPHTDVYIVGYHTARPVNDSPGSDR